VLAVRNRAVASCAASSSRSMIKRYADPAGRLTFLSYPAATFRAMTSPNPSPVAGGVLCCGEPGAWAPAGRPFVIGYMAVPEVANLLAAQPNQPARISTDRLAPFANRAW